MRAILSCRRTFITVMGISCLTALGIVHGTDVSLAIAGCVAALAGSNAAEASMRHKHSPKE